MTTTASPNFRLPSFADDAEEYHSNNPSFTPGGPCFMTSDQKRHLLESLLPLTALVLLEIGHSDDLRSCASTPPRDRECRMCHKPTLFDFSLCTYCHHLENLRRCKVATPSPPAPVPVQGCVCWKCKEHSTASPVVLCRVCESNFLASFKSTTVTPSPPAPVRDCVCWKCKVTRTFSPVVLCTECEVKVLASLK